VASLCPPKPGIQPGTRLCLCFMLHLINCSLLIYVCDLELVIYCTRLRLECFIENTVYSPILSYQALLVGENYLQ
jgi:hypothetical protein